MVSVSSIGWSSRFGFLRHDMSPCRYNIQIFLGFTVPPESIGAELGSSDQEASPLAGEKTRVILEPCCTWCVPLQVFLVSDFS